MKLCEFELLLLESLWLYEKQRIPPAREELFAMFDCIEVSLDIEFEILIVISWTKSSTISNIR